MVVEDAIKDEEAELVEVVDSESELSSEPEDELTVIEDDVSSDESEIGEASDDEYRSGEMYLVMRVL